MIATVVLAEPTYRLIPSRYPPISAFDSVASANDLEAVMELEGWTNDRLVLERMARLNKAEWIYGIPNASVVMASFLHGGPTGLRFTCPELNGWYAALSRRTAIAEVAHHLRREALNMRVPSLTLQYRTYTAALAGSYHDIRGMTATRPELYKKDDYTASQSFGEALRASGGDGILYDSVRHSGGTNVVALRPKNVRDIVMGVHYEITAPVSGKVIARSLPSSSGMQAAGPDN
jgi:RES domain-containing protein